MAGGGGFVGVLWSVFTWGQPLLAGCTFRALGSGPWISAPVNAYQVPTASGIREGLGAGQVYSNSNHRELIRITQEDFHERLATLMSRG